ncbi:response regulator [Marinimicrobium agarilyticum]|uniref:response regulator n=1 Tax=Marinimicrobium agarilyticum TaxID=306546 RepID=UPI00040EECC2|nr:response regulator [Marinimicrobium agarilyticum]
MHDVTIAIVEDDDGHAHLIKKNLRRGNINNTVERFSNGQLFLDYLKTEQAKARHHLVLLDLNMPVLDGYEVLNRMKADERFKRIPVVVLTTTDDPREIERCYDAGCNVYITKPVEYEKFSAAIRELGLLLNVMAVP